MKLINHLANGIYQQTSGLSCMVLNSMGYAKATETSDPSFYDAPTVLWSLKSAWDPSSQGSTSFSCPPQVGVGTSLGCEAKVHATYYFMDQPHSENVLLKLDIKNAFNNIWRVTVLQEAKNTSQKSAPLYGTVILQKHLFFTETSAWIRPPVQVYCTWVANFTRCVSGLRRIAWNYFQLQ